MTADACIKQLRRAARRMPRAHRDELVAQIEEHLREALPVGATEAAVRTELDRLGDPAEIVAAEHERLGLAPVSGGWFAWIALGLLLIGGLILPILGWLVGAIMLWISHVWTWREKLAGTLIVPGGLGGAALFVLLVGSGGESCGGSGGPGRPTVFHCTQTRAAGPAERAQHSAARRLGARVDRDGRLPGSAGQARRLTSTRRSISPASGKSITTVPRRPRARPA